ncbi:MAG: hypothetical protein COW00_10750 [Bdellovibrio sp. CG12_big_fil_rev_8_21_14_0_65_39_13]|nr:MAG: hypothetical protein COW78_13625 [Bdellovibrio sp. CG22_combo_CG10-13_8_21_14_all_39_27]PIQ59427.1 MAG: hypothetical protein COW00_10750 [Bdellovibrio sp. CG12_big_fil_rev_8_21_14_0_65_39_13]PIR34917.1 MAG: hypothetical protein COV37_11695 [Bdellovibrio sp. CG11_big_fil_rev_8_21_14_0_20_39_38]
MNKRVLFIALVGSMLVSFGCGKDTKKSDEAGAEYFSQFATASNGIPLQSDLQVSSVTNAQGGSGYYGYYTNTSTVTNDIHLRLDTDGSFFLYRKPVSNFFSSQVDQDNFRYNGLVGTWKIEATKLVLEGVGSTLDYNINTNLNNSLNGGYYNSTPVGQYEYSDKCFTVEIRSTIKLDTNVSYDNGARQETDALMSGQIAKFCHP